MEMKEVEAKCETVLQEMPEDEMLCYIKEKEGKSCIKCSSLLIFNLFFQTRYHYKGEQKEDRKRMDVKDKILMKRKR